MAMTMFTEGDEAVIAEMNTTPLIDVMLVLLIMLIITIPVQTHAVKLNMPTNGSSVPDEPPPVVEIAVAADGTVTWDGLPVPDRQALEVKISHAAELSPQPEVHVRPDRSARYEIVAMVMAASQRLGLQKLGLTGNEQFAEE